MHRLFPSEFFHFEAMRLLSFTPYEGCEIAEFLDAVGKIRDCDVESWYCAWMEAGVRAEEVAAEAEQAANREAARRAFLRASNYQRAAQFMLNGRNPSTEPRILRVSETSISNFGKAQYLMDAAVVKLEIPYQDITLPGYLYLPAPSKQLPGKLPILLNTVGGDATQEEIFFILPREGLELGYAVVTFEGPGQGLVLRRDKIPMRPDWEIVVTAVLDHIVEHAKANPKYNLDVNKFAIAGSSVGGYLCLRGASDSRVKACISVDPFFDMWDLLKGRVPEFLIHAFEAGGFVPDYIWEIFANIVSTVNPQTKWEFNHLRWMLGVQTVPDVFRRMQEFTFKQRDATNWLEKVKCPVFVTGAASSMYAMPEISTTKIYNSLAHLGEKRVQWIAENPYDGGYQSKVGALGLLNMKAFAWLDSVFDIDRKIPYKKMGRIDGAPSSKGNSVVDVPFSHVLGRNERDDCLYIAAQQKNSGVNIASVRGRQAGYR
ncbi:hypothetical protein AMS68_002432 [Peltaster fructicola]|uniref:AB hydrolase-1 domain-containing protein n=1 Tax=Peltaster fructicola TaxID=286661 RepID=A0A6H0XQK5_9PEZI|nr:hypothetical protein AMS68_002432 [Peltaster fructicola]